MVLSIELYLIVFETFAQIQRFKLIDHPIETSQLFRLAYVYGVVDDHSHGIVFSPNQMRNKSMRLENWR